MKSRQHLLAFLFLILASSSCMAQGGGMLGGRVTNEDGQPVKNATIKILGTTPARGAISRQDGTFMIANLRADTTYDLQITSIGYKSLIVCGISVNADSASRLDASFTREMRLSVSVTREICRPSYISEKMGTTRSIVFKR